MLGSFFATAPLTAVRIDRDLGELTTEYSTCGVVCLPCGPAGHGWTMNVTIADMLVAAGFYMRTPILSSIALLGPTLRHLVLLDIRLTSSRVLECVIGSLPHLQVLCSDDLGLNLLLFCPSHFHCTVMRISCHAARDSAWPDVAQHCNVLRVQALVVSCRRDTNDNADLLVMNGGVPSILALGRAAAEAHLPLRMLSLRCVDAFQSRVPAESSSGSLAALSSLTQLTCLDLAGMPIRQWPPGFSQLTALQLLSMVDRYGEMPVYPTAAEEPRQLMPHRLQALPQLHTLGFAGLSWMNPLPVATLTRLVLWGDDWPRAPRLMLPLPEVLPPSVPLSASQMQAEQSAAMLQQLAGMSQLRWLSVRDAQWLAKPVRALVEALGQCRRLRTLCLLGCRLCPAWLPGDLSGIAHLESLSLVNSTGPGQCHCSGHAPMQLSQLTACRRLRWSPCKQHPKVEQFAAFVAMPQLEQLTLSPEAWDGVHYELRLLYRIWQPQLSAMRLEAMSSGGFSGPPPPLRLVLDAVPNLWTPAMLEVPFEECNDLLGQQVRKQVWTDWPWD